MLLNDDDLLLFRLMSIISSLCIRYPSELVDFLRLLLVEPEDLGMQPIDNIDFNEPISPSLERRVLTTMINICESYLQQYPTSLDDDDKLITDRKLFAVLSRQQRMAVKLRASEKRILQVCLLLKSLLMIIILNKAYH
jgi:hypothetical protein